MMVKFLDLLKINQQYEEEIRTAFENVFQSGWYIQGQSFKEFENAYAAYCGAKYCIGVANGLDALSLIIRAYMELNLLAEGDEVLVPSNTYIASILAISENGLKPELVEPDPQTYNMDCNQIRKHITRRTKAVLPVH